MNSCGFSAGLSLPFDAPAPDRYLELGYYERAMALISR